MIALRSPEPRRLIRSWPSACGHGDEPSCWLFDLKKLQSFGGPATVSGDRQVASTDSPRYRVSPALLQFRHTFRSEPAAAQGRSVSLAAADARKIAKGAIASPPPMAHPTASPVPM